MSSARGPDDATETRRDLSVALRNALKLGGSLLATWAVAIVVRFQLPRQMGPTRFGEFAFADSYSASLFILLGLGIDTYIQKEVSVRPKHASDFFGAVLALRLALSVVVLAGLVLSLQATHRTGEILPAAVVFGLTQGLTALNTSLSALLQSATKVGRLAATNVISKVVWGGAVLIALHFGPPLWVLVVPLFATELLKSVVLWVVVRRELDLRLRIDMAKARVVLVVSFPFFVNFVAYSLGSKLDITMLEFLAPNQEVGWYGAANQLAALALLLSPLVSWVLMPLLTRARARSDDEFFSVLRRAIEAVLVGAIPATMILSIGADVWIRLLYRSAYDPAISTLRVLAPSFVLTYTAVLLSTALLLFDRAWTVTLVSLGSLALQPCLILLAVPWGAHRFGAGGAGLGNAMVFSFLELFSVVGFWIPLGRRAVDRRCVVAVFFSLMAFAAVAVLDLFIRSLGPLRLAVDACVYTALIFGTRAVRIEDVRAVVQMVLERRRERAVAKASA